VKTVVSVIVIVVLAFFLAFMNSGCTENRRAKSLGGSATHNIPKGKKLITATWKNSDLWLLTRVMGEDEYPETYEFKEVSSFGILEGTVTLIESK